VKLYWHSSKCGEPDEEIIDPELGYEPGDWEPCCMCDLDDCIATVEEREE
jgi:hypothetical protein